MARPRKGSGIAFAARALAERKEIEAREHAIHNPPPPPIMPAPTTYLDAEGKEDKKAVKEAAGELHHAPMAPASDNVSGLSYETNMAAFEAQDPAGRYPTSANVGYSSIKSGFRR